MLFQDTPSTDKDKTVISKCKSLVSIIVYSQLSTHHTNQIKLKKSEDVL